ncbi:MAG: septum formation initiator family protein [Bacteroidales bacterium]|nr:septum formation initiator family protein [Bacteroidales bacterium]
MKLIDVQKFKQCTDFVSKHKYMVATVIFLLIVLFFDSKSFFGGSLPVILQNRRLEKEKNFYRGKIYHDSLMLHELQTNDENLKRFAREEYKMKADDEVIFVINER